MEEEDKSIYDLELNEATRVDAFLWVRRVPGGWIYEYARKDVYYATMVFVPFVDKRVELTQIELDRIVEKLTVEEIKCLLNRKMKID